MSFWSESFRLPLSRAFCIDYPATEQRLRGLTGFYLREEQ
jgi:hypothetical protein